MTNIHAPRKLDSIPLAIRFAFKRSVSFLIISLPVALYASSTDDEIIKKLEFFQAYEVLEATSGSSFEQWSQMKVNPVPDKVNGKKGNSHDDSMDN